MSKSLAKNSAYLVIYKFLTVFFPLITVSYASHIIFADGMGKVASAQNIVQYFVLIAGLGIPIYGIRETSICRNSVSSLSKVFSELILINTISTTICIISYYILITCINVCREEYLLYYLIGITVFLNYFNVDWFYQGFEEFAYIAKRSFFVKCISLALLIIFVRNRDDYVIYSVINMIGVAGNNILNCYNLKKYNIHISLRGISIRRHLKPIFLLLSTTVAIELYTMVDTTMLTFLCDSDQVAYYTNSVKIVRLIVIFVTSIGGVLLPRLSYYKSKGQIEDCCRVVNRVMSIIFILIVPCCVGVYMLSDSIVLVLFGDSFANGITTMKLASWLILALGFSNLFGTQVLLTFKDEKKLLYCTVIGAISNLSLNIILIPQYAQLGAVSASIVSEIIVTILSFYYARKHLSIRLSTKPVLSVLCSCIMMIISIAIVNMLTSNFTKLLAGIIIGGLVYIICLFASRNEYLDDIIVIIRKNFLKK